MSFMALLLQKSMAVGLTPYEERLYNQLCTTSCRQARFDELITNRKILAFQSQDSNAQSDPNPEEPGIGNQQTEIQ